MHEKKTNLIIFREGLSQRMFYDQLLRCRVLISFFFLIIFYTNDTCEIRAAVQLGDATEP